MHEFFSRFNEDPFHQYMGLKLVAVAPDKAQLRLERTSTTPEGIGGSINGGVLATMVDMAAVAAVFTNLKEASVPAGTADLSITYLRQAQGQWVDAEAQVLKRGRQLCTIEVKIMNDEGTVCAIGRVLYALRSGEP